MTTSGSAPVSRSKLNVAVVTDIQQRCWDTSASKGFHRTDTFRDAVNAVLAADEGYNNNDSYPSPETNEVIDIIVHGLERDWEQMQHAKRLLLIVGEVSEAFEELRAGRAADEVYEKDGKPEGVPVELADVQIRLWDLAHSMGISLQQHVEDKQAYNEGRPYLHGKQF